MITQPASDLQTVEPTPTAGCPKKLTALHNCHLAAGAQMVEDAGWQRPDRYGSFDEELAAARERVGLIDLSPVGKLDLKGAAGQISAFGTRLWKQDAQDAQDRIGGVTSSCVSRASCSPVTHSAAEMQDHVLVRCCRLTPDHCLLLTAPGEEAPVRERLAAGGGDGVYLTDVTSVLAGLSLVGPRARDVLRKLTALDVAPAALPDSACAETGIAGVHALLLRSDLGDVPAYEIYVTRDVAEFLWDTILDAGREYAITLLGLSAYRALSADE